MSYTLDSLTDAITGLDAFAEAGGMKSTEVAFGFLLGALAIGDRNVSGGLTRDDFLKMAQVVYDKSRGSLAIGRMA